MTRCIDCSALALSSPCPACRRQRDRARNARRTHYRGDYDRRAKQIRDRANRDPFTLCWRCGQPAKPGDPWQAGHLVDTDPYSPLAPEHASCNSSAGASYGNLLRHSRTSRTW